MLIHISDPSPASLKAINVTYSNVLRTIEVSGLFKEAELKVTY